MISTALALQDASAEALIQMPVLIKARELYQNKDTMSNQEFSDALFEYSATLSAICATMVTGVLLTETQISELQNTIEEMSSMGKGESIE